MVIDLRYYSRSKKGNTIKLASAIAEVLNKTAETIDKDLDSEVDYLFLANAMYASTVDRKVKNFLERNKDKIKCIINVNSSATGRPTIKAIRKVASKYNIEVLEKEFHTIGSWLNLHKGRPNEDDLNKLKDFVTNTINDFNE
jgi:flavodoxin